MAFRPRIRLCWYVLGVFAGMCIAFATYWWLDGPRWRNTSAGPGYSPSFSLDGTTVSTFHGFGYEDLFAPQIVTWDTVTGRMVSRVSFAWDGPRPRGMNISTRSVPGEQFVLIGLSPQDSGSQTVVTNFVYDARTGRKVAGPFESGDAVTKCSRDGRWCIASQLESGLVDSIIEVAIARKVWPPATDDDHEWLPWSAAFAPDSTQFAVLWIPSTVDKPFPRFIAIYELPSCREARRFDLPARGWERIRSWGSDDRLYLETDDERPDDWVTSSFSMVGADFGVERIEPLYPYCSPYESKYTLLGDGWIAQVDTHDFSRASAIRTILWKVDQALKTSLASSTGASVRVLDASSGEVRGEFSRVGYDCTISRDGRWIASADDAVQVWSVPPPRQTLWATCAGLATLGIVLTVGQRRSRPRSSIFGQIPIPSA